MKYLFILLFGALLCSNCETPTPETTAPSCETPIAIEGEYVCTGECVITGRDSTRQLIKVSGETDRLEKYPDSENGLYQVEITGGDDFQETEIGPLTGNILRTATAKVSDDQYPVLEEYVFDTDEDCRATGFTKIVRNPTQAQFKTCVILCRRVGE